MEPAIPSGSIVEYEKGDPEPGDIAVFISQGKVMVHRVLARWQTRQGVYYVHRGDNASDSGIFAAHELIGVVM
ncbi:MAG: S24/S26 family peptidase, partial [Planctomycetaceae bacterium]|nr:S24/S26 family peptidase [Planctomycetaceae bacterium]